MTPDWFAFQTYRTLTGAPMPADLIRRGGRSAPRHRRDWDADPAVDNPRPFAVRRRVLRDLTRIERRTWRRILAGWAIDTIARADGISRAAVYARIRGSDGRGGMVRKNPYVARWWAGRRALPAHPYDQP